MLDMLTSLNGLVRCLKQISLSVGLIITLVSCQTAELKFQKGYLLDTTMDPNKSSHAAERSNQEAPNWNEKATNNTGGGFGSSCPTCGG
jgi:hypothetical protein